MLADHAAVAEGKLFINGGGWTTTIPDPSPLAIAGIIDVPWDETNKQHTFRLELLDTDGHAVLVDTPNGQEPLFVEGGFEVGRPPGVKAGTPLPFPFAFGIMKPPLQVGRYEWRLSIDGEGDEDWSLPFNVIQPPGGQQVAA
jgi:hypothetical protein